MHIFEGFASFFLWGATGAGFFLALLCIGWVDLEEIVRYFGIKEEKIVPFSWGVVIGVGVVAGLLIPRLIA